MRHGANWKVWPRWGTEPAEPIGAPAVIAPSLGPRDKGMGPGAYAKQWSERQHQMCAGCLLTSAQRVTEGCAGRHQRGALLSPKSKRAYGRSTRIELARPGRVSVQ